MEAVVNALNKGLTVTDNTTGDIKSVTLYAVPTVLAPATISWTKPIAPQAVLVGNTQRVDNTAVTLSAAVQVQWFMQNPSTLAITNVVGITPTTPIPYFLTLVCI